MIQMTYREALEIQARQLDHYCAIVGEGLRAKVAAETMPCATPNHPMPVHIINELVPRGTDIERLAGLVWTGND